jgi:hypothetical protein
MLEEQAELAPIAERDREHLRREQRRELARLARHGPEVDFFAIRARENRTEDAQLFVRCGGR